MTENSRSIECLTSSVIRLIGSGQVITGVYSVIKELIENSVDAGATHVEVKLEDFGFGKIEVVDNGYGIKPSDVEFMAKRHYTSKLESTSDLSNILTYGFRGEALASLCSMADVTVLTKTEAEEVGRIYYITPEGDIRESKPMPCSRGTIVTAHKLFKNIPVRKQFYSSKQKKKDELKKIEDLVFAYSLVIPSLRISLKHEKDIIWQKFPQSDDKSAVQAVFGRNVFSHMLQKSSVRDDSKIKIKLFIPKPGSDVKSMSRSSIDKTVIAVNNRPVLLKELVKLLKSYYNNCHANESPRCPLSFVSIDIPLEFVDVNVDPNKTTVFLQNLADVRTCLEEILLEIYGPLDNVPSWKYTPSTKASDISKELSNKEDKDTSNHGQIFSRDVLALSVLTNRVDDLPHKSEVCLSETTKDNEFVNGISTCPIEKTDKVPDLNTQILNEILADDDCFSEELENDETIKKLLDTAQEENQNKLNLENTNTESGLSWSRGICLKDDAGNKIQPVRLLQAPSTTTPIKRQISQERLTPTNKRQCIETPEHGQPTLKSFMRDSSNKHPSAFDFFYDVYLQKNDLDESDSQKEEIRNIWNELPENEKLQFREEVLKDRKRNEIENKREERTKQASPKKKVATKNMRMEVADVASQSQAGKTTQKMLKRRIYHKEAVGFICMPKLKHKIDNTPESTDQLKAIGSLEDGSLFVCIREATLYALDAKLLSAKVLFERMLEKHQLPPSPCQPVDLTQTGLGTKAWQMLRKISETQNTGDVQFKLTDERFTANGVQIRCHIDTDGDLSAELCGLSKLVADFDVQDVTQLLHMIEHNTSLRNTRPDKVVKYLQNEALRLSNQNTRHSLSDIQELLNTFHHINNLKPCQFAEKPIFHKLFNLQTL